MIIALAVTGIFASALIIPQLAVSQSSYARGLGYNQNGNPWMSGRMGGIMGPGIMNGMPMIKGMMGYYSGVPDPLSHDSAKVVGDG